MQFEGLTREEARAFAERWLPAWSGNRPELLASFYGEDAFYADPAIPAGLRGREALLAYFRRLLAHNPNWVWTQRDSIPLQGGFLNLWHAAIPVGGRVLELDGVCTVQLRDGKIARNEVFFDRSALLEALRAAAAPPAPRDESPRGDPARHLDGAALDAGVRALPAPALDAGRLALIVRRLPTGARETPREVRLSVEEGVPGDDWSRRPPRKPEAQLAVMRRDVAELIANGQPLTLFGDQLFVDLDVSAGNLPAGTRLRVGESLVEMTAEPHDGCRKFQQRFGADALRFVQAKPTRHENRRGVYWRVIEPGLAHVGDAVLVIWRP
jgi:MOSC domain-containing protein YiiM